MLRVNGDPALPAIGDGYTGVAGIIMPATGSTLLVQDQAGLLAGKG
jgi:hypothetical protein